MKVFTIVSALLLFTALTLAQSTDIIFFSDSPDGDQIYDASWGFQTAPSYLERGPNDKFPVDPQHPYQGAHSLRLHWISNSGGDWGMAVASVGWVGHNITQYDSLVYWINGPQSISQSDLPDLSLEDLSNHKSTRVALGSYLTGVDADSNSWQKVMIPLADFLPGTENCDFTRIKTIYHWQKNADGVEHTAWLDEIRMIQEGGGSGTIPERPALIWVRGSDSRIDLKWTRNTEADLAGYYVYRSANLDGPYTKITNVARDPHLYSDFFGSNNQTYYYYVTAANNNLQESANSDTGSATSAALSEEELITSVQEATFRYFYDYGHPVSGLARERLGSGDVCTSGGTGMGLLTQMVGAERGFEPRDSVATHVLKILSFLSDVTPRYHGAWAHWINGTTGATIPFSQYDDGGDLIETAFLIQGVLAVRKYFTLDNAVENEIRQRATAMWESVEWDWYRRLADTNGDFLFWHWSPNFGWQMNFPISGFNEGMIAYLLGIASTTHHVPASTYYNGWASSGSYANGNNYYGYTQWVGWPYGGPLFFTHYSYLGFDPRGKSDSFCNYFENNKNISLINRAYCIDNPEGHTGYSALVWGLTASDDPWGYLAHEPIAANDNGTITPTAAISAMPYVPAESKATLNHFYYTYGADLWGEFGFKDAFNLDANWFAKSYLAIDQGTMVPMIENYRTGLCWNKFMENAEITAMLDSIGFVVGINDDPPIQPASYSLAQNYPNPFNPQTVIEFSLAKSGIVNLLIYDSLGRKVATVYENKKMSAGAHKVTFDARKLSSGVYFYRLTSEQFTKVRKMLVVR